MKKLKPVLRYHGSKYRKIEYIINKLNIQKNSNFLDMFGGSLIIGTNIKHLIDCSVTINDFDNITENKQISDNKALINMLTFEGNGKNFTKASHEYFLKRVENGYWDKLDEYNNILQDINITQQHFQNMHPEYLSQFSHIYIDPPYHNIKGLYKESFNDDNHIELGKILNEIIKINPNIKIMISYNDTELIRDIYKNWNIETLEFIYVSSKRKGINGNKVNELVITNFKGEINGNKN